MVKELRTVVETLQAMDCVKMAERLKTMSAMIVQDEKHLTEVMTTVSLQELVAQRVKKLVTILDEAQHKLVVRVVVFGLQQNGETPVMEGKAGEMLKQLEESKTTAIKQKVADDIRAQFGFQ
jgi:chemotaxis protein CheZ